MKIAIDVFYRNDIAKIVAATFNNWHDRSPTEIVIKHKMSIIEYIPGEFYKKELPCLTEIIANFDLNEIDVIIIDGYVYLNDDGNPGLGAYLYEYLKQKVSVIGVAKTPFHNNTKHVKEVYRGKSQQPLYITAIGTDLGQAAKDVKSMYGEFRMPQILKLIDTETKK